MNKLLQCASLFLFRPYISHELPGWGRLYSLIDGGYHADKDWAWMGTRWVRGKLHDYDMFVDLGQWSNRQTYLLRRLYDLPTQLILQKYLRPGDTFVDIGANEGALSLLASRLVGPHGKVLSFEPNPRPRQIFARTIARNKINNIDVVSVGLGERDETLELTAPKINSGEGSFGRSNYSGEDIETIRCALKRGDDALLGTAPKLIKIDVEGFELSVLRGLSQTIATHRPLIVMEMISAHLANCGTTPQEISCFMKEHGYRSLLTGSVRHLFSQTLDLAETKIGSDVNGDILWIHD